MESKTNSSDSDIDKGTINALSKRKNAIKILMFLTDKDDAYYLQEIADNLDLCEMTALQNLSKLIDAGIVEKTETVVDKRTKYYKVIDKKMAEKAIAKYKDRVGFLLARLVPYNKTHSSYLKSDKRFVEACQEHGLSVSEGIKAVLRCPKIGSEYFGHDSDTVLWRKEQGFIPKKEKIVTNEVEEI